MMLDEGIMTAENFKNCRFLFKKAPVTEKQELKKRVRECIIRLDDSWAIILRKC